MQTWDYKFIKMYLEGMGINLHWHWEEDGKKLPDPPAVLVKAKELGDQGWELVSVTSFADSKAFFYWFKRPRG